jgi:hypothetical protein
VRSLKICNVHQIFFDDKIEKNELGVACSAYGEGSGVYRVLVGKPEGKRPLGRPWHSWEDNMMTFQEVESGVMD